MTAHPAWYVVQVAPNMESSAQSNLTRQRYQVKHLKCIERRIRSGRPIDWIAPLFPGYIFVSLTPNQPWGEIIRTKHVTDILKADGEPAPLPSDVAEGWLGRADCTGLIGFARRRYALGTRLKVTGGPFESHVGSFDGLDSDGRLGILFTVMGRQCRVPVDEAQIEAA